MRNTAEIRRSNTTTRRPLAQQPLAATLRMAMTAAVALTCLAPASSCSYYSKEMRTQRAYNRYVTESMQKKRERQQEFIEARQRETAEVIQSGAVPSAPQMQIQSPPPPR